MSDFQLTPEVGDLLGEIGTVAMSASATALSSLIGRRVEITAPRVEAMTWDSVPRDSLLGHIAIQVTYSEGICGTTYLAIKEGDAAVLVDLMLGRDGSVSSPIEQEALVSGISEAATQMMGASATAMGEVMSRVVKVGPPSCVMLATESDIESLRGQDQVVARVSFKMSIDHLLEATVHQLIAASFLPALAELAQQAPGRVPGAMAPAARGAQVDASSGAPARPSPPARPVEFGQLSPHHVRAADGNISLLYDVPLQVTVELGRTRMRVREVLGLGPGAVVELERLSGEPVDLFLNDRLFARGEVVVIEENFGVRITEIVNSETRMQTAVGVMRS